MWSIAGTGDFDATARADILWHDTSGNVAIWHDERGDGVVSQRARFGARPSGRSPSTGDFNGDGKSDILWHDTSGNVAIWFMNDDQILKTTIVAAAPTDWHIV